MASANRDLSISVVSKTEKFDLSDVEQSLEQTGQAGETAGRDVDKGLSKIEAATKDAGRQAETTRAEFDRFFDKLKTGSQQAGRDVDAGMDKARKGVDDFKDEAKQSGREAAASFTGSFDDVVSTVREIGANAFAGFGALGGLAGAAAAAGLGAIISKVQESQERVKELTQSFLDLRRDGIDPAADAVSHMTDEMDAADLRTWKDDADKLGISYQTLRDAFDGNAEAIAAVRDAMSTYNAEAQAHANGQKVPLEQFAGLRDRLGEVETGYTNSAYAAQFLGTQTQAAKDRTEEMSGALQGVSEDAADMADAIDKGADAVIKAQEKQLKATLDLEKNTKTVLDRLGQDAVDWALSQGESADEAMQLLANAPLAKGQQIVANYRKLGEHSSEAHAQGILAGKPAITRVTDEIHDDMRAILGRRINTPVGVTVDRGSLAAARREIGNSLNGIRVTVDAIAQSAIFGKNP
ncbi:hypothetical protein GCM10027053_03840 [Intrasporangium mesophilum]